MYISLHRLSRNFVRSSLRVFFPLFSEVSKKDEIAQTEGRLIRSERAGFAGYDRRNNFSFVLFHNKQKNKKDN